jgi:hypothetical protein
MESAYALDSHYLASPQSPNRLLQSLFTVNLISLLVAEPKMGSAYRTGVGLGMISPMFDILVFPPALGAHVEGPHGRHGTIVRHVGDDGKARAAIGAIDKGVPMAPIAGIQQLPLTTLAEADVWGNQNELLINQGAFPNGKGFQTSGWLALNPLVHHVGHGRGVFRNSSIKLLHPLPGALNLDDNSPRKIAYRPSQIVLTRQTMNKGAEANSLNYTPEGD